MYLPGTRAFTWTVMTPQPSAVGKRATKKVFYILTAVDKGFYLPKSNSTFFSPPAEYQDPGDTHVRTQAQFLLQAISCHFNFAKMLSLLLHGHFVQNFVFFFISVIFIILSILLPES